MPRTKMTRQALEVASQYFSSQESAMQWLASIKESIRSRQQLQNAVNTMFPSLSQEQRASHVDTLQAFISR